MKNKLIVPVAIFAISLFTIACNGDHSDRTVRDTTNKGNVHDIPSMSNEAPSNIDTTKATGDASTVDNSGSGGTKIDSVKKTKPNK